MRYKPQVVKCIAMGLPPKTEDLMCSFKKWDPEKFILCRVGKSKRKLNDGLDFKKLKN